VFRVAARIYREMDKRLRPETRHRLARRFPALRRRVEVMMSYARVVWSRTIAYTDGKRPEIWINLRGRQQQGIVAPEEFERVRQELIDDLTSAVSPTTGRPLVTRVQRREDAYHGPFVDRSPDLVIEWAGEGTGLDVAYPDGRSFTLRKQHLPDDPFDHLLSGGHDRLGILGLLGPGVRRGRLDEVAIADVAPTVLALRGAPIPADVDGRVLNEAFEEPLDAASGGDGSVEVGVGVASERRFSDEEEEEIAERLRGLGYVE